MEEKKEEQEQHRGEKKEENEDTRHGHNHDETGRTEEPVLVSQQQQQQQHRHFQPLYRNNSFPGALACSHATMTSNNNITVITHLTGDGSESRIIEDEVVAVDDADDDEIDQGEDRVNPPKIPRPSLGLPCRTSSAPLFQHDSQRCRGDSQAQQLPPDLVRREPLKRKVIRRTLFAICIFFGQSFACVALKRYGIIERDMNQVMAERFAPAQQALAGYMPDMQALEIKIQETIENARLMAPGLNDTMYWLKLNNQLLQLQKEDPSVAGTGVEKTAESTTSTTGRLRPGQRLAQRIADNEEQKKQQLGLSPVVMIPGFVTSGLEVWKGKDCMESGFFRQVR